MEPKSNLDQVMESLLSIRFSVYEMEADIEQKFSAYEKAQEKLRKDTATKNAIKALDDIIQSLYDIIVGIPREDYYQNKAEVQSAFFDTSSKLVDAKMKYAKVLSLSKKKKEMDFLEVSKESYRLIQMNPGVFRGVYEAYPEVKRYKSAKSYDAKVYVMMDSVSDAFFKLPESTLNHFLENDSEVYKMAEQEKTVASYLYDLKEREVFYAKHKKLIDEIEAFKLKCGDGKKPKNYKKDPKVKESSVLILNEFDKVSKEELPVFNRMQPDFKKAYYQDIIKEIDATYLSDTLSEYHDMIEAVQTACKLIPSEVIYDKNVWLACDKACHLISEMPGKDFDYIVEHDESGFFDDCNAILEYVQQFDKEQAFRSSLELLKSSLPLVPVLSSERLEENMEEIRDVICKRFKDDRMKCSEYAKRMLDHFTEKDFLEFKPILMSEKISYPYIREVLVVRSEEELEYENQYLACYTSLLHICADRYSVSYDLVCSHVTGVPFEMISHWYIRDLATMIMGLAFDASNVSRKDVESGKPFKFKCKKKGSFSYSLIKKNYLFALRAKKALDDLKEKGIVDYE